MDNSSDEFISFDNQGYCNYCSDALATKDEYYFPNEIGKQKLEELIGRLKKENKEKEYDCIMGISGGLDSSYLAYLGAVKWNLRILAVHIDDGFDTELAKNNIKNLCEKANIELVTIKPDETQFKELTRAYILAEVPNIAVPQDNVLMSTLYKFAKSQNIKTFLSGANFSLESILQKGNTHNAYDLRNIKDIHRLFGREKINKLALMSKLKKDLDNIFLRTETIAPLNYFEYTKSDAIKELEEFCDYKYYEAKHLENIFTKFVQVYWLYNKFGVDKRKSHLSSMIVSGQLSRDEAIEILNREICNKEVMENEIKLILEELDLDRNQFDEIMKRAGRQHNEYKTSIYIALNNTFVKILSKNTKQFIKKMIAKRDMH